MTAGMTWQNWVSSTQGIGSLKVSFILLAHEPPDDLRQLIDSVLSSGSDLYVHYDKKSEHDLQQYSFSWDLHEHPGKICFVEREAIEWGEWSIVRATLRCLAAWRDSKDESDYVMLISGSCLPTKPLEQFSSFLKENPRDYVETMDAVENRWVSHGDQLERWSHYSLFNWRRNPRLFSLSNKLQKKLGVCREIPLGHRPHIGSQWWCLRRSTLLHLLELIGRNQQLLSFYKYTWIPDEFFFQTLVASTVPVEQISGLPLTLNTFNSSGVAEVRYDDSIISLLESDAFFARKISPYAKVVRSALEPVFVMRQQDFPDYVIGLRKTHPANDQRETLLLRKGANNAWHAFITSAYLASTYCKTIPNSIIVVCGGSSGRRLIMAERISQHRNVSAFGHIFSTEEIEYAAGTTSVAGYGRGHYRLAQHRWHFFLGDLCHENPGNTIVFCLGDNAAEYISELRFKHGLAIAMLEDSETDLATSGSGVSEEKRHLRARIGFEQLMLRRNCQLYRVKAGEETLMAETVFRHLQN